MAELHYHLSEKAVEHIAEAAMRTVPGSIALDAKLAGLAGRSLPRATAHTDTRAGTVAIVADIAVAYPSPAAAVADAIRATVISHVKALTGLRATQVNIKVVNAKAAGPGAGVSSAQLANYDAEIEPVPVKVRSSSARLAPVTVATGTQTRTTGFTPPLAPLAPVTVPEPAELAAVRVTPAAAISPRTPAPMPLRPIYIEPVVISHVPGH